MSNLPDDFNHAAWVALYEPIKEVDDQYAVEALTRCFAMSELLMAALDNAHGEVAHYDLEELTELEAAMKKLLLDFPIIAKRAKPADALAIRKAVVS